MAQEMTPQHFRWPEFINRLKGPEGCNFAEDEDGKITWDCNGLGLAAAILSSMDMDIEASLEYFREHGGHCDCEIVFNVR